MKQKQLERWAYAKPECEMMLAETEQFICVSVRPNAGGSIVQPGYDDKGEHDAGTVYFGDPSSVAPAKQGGFWDEEEEEF